MSNAYYLNGKKSILNGTLDLSADNLKAVLVDLNDYALPVTGASNASPIAITATAHGLATGDVVAISGVLGNTAANGVWVVTNTGANTFTLNGSTGNGTYTSGGFVIKVGTDDNLDDIPAGARVATSANLASKTFTISGLVAVFDAADAQFTSVSGDVSEAVVIYKDTGTPGTSTLIAIFMTGVTGLPVTPDGNNISLTWAAAGILTF